MASSPRCPCHQQHQFSCLTSKPPTIIKNSRWLRRPMTLISATMIIIVLQPFTIMIIVADRTGILPRLVCKPRHPLLDVHVTNSTNFHVSRLFDLPRISKGTIRHAPQDNAINHRERSKEPQRYPIAAVAVCTFCGGCNIWICTKSMHRLNCDWWLDRPPIKVETARATGNTGFRSISKNG